MDLTFPYTHWNLKSGISFGLRNHCSTQKLISSILLVQSRLPLGVYSVYSSFKTEASQLTISISPEVNCNISRPSKVVRPFTIAPSGVS